jgi:hypothetical protein
LNNDVIALQSSILLLLLWFFLNYLWRDYRIDAFRDHLFGARQRLFMFAANGGVSFDHPAYTMLRYRMNVVLRYAHEFTLSRAITVAIFQRAPKAAPERARWEAAVESLPIEVQKQLREFNTVLAIAILQLMVYRSFFLYLMVRPIIPFVQTREVLRKSPTVVTRVEQLESQAVEDENAHRNGEPLAVV